MQGFNMILDVKSLGKGASGESLSSARELGEAFGAPFCFIASGAICSYVLLHAC